MRSLDPRGAHLDRGGGVGVGWLLGGTVGVGTLLYAVSIGPLAHYFIPKLSVSPAETGPGRETGRKATHD